MLIDVLRLEQRDIIGLIAKKKGMVDAVAGVPVLGDDDSLAKYTPGSCELVNGIGSTGEMSARKAIYSRFKKLGYKFTSVKHPSAILSSDISIGEGTQVMAGAIIQPGVQIGDNCIVNTGAKIDHDCVIGNHVHIAPGAVISGNVKIGEATHIGIGAILIQNVSIGSECLVNASATVTTNVPDKHQAKGNPAGFRRRTDKSAT